MIRSNDRRFLKRTCCQFSGGKLAETIANSAIVFPPVPEWRAAQRERLPRLVDAHHLLPCHDPIKNPACAGFLHCLGDEAFGFVPPVELDAVRGSDPSSLSSANSRSVAGLKSNCDHPGSVTVMAMDRFGNCRSMVIVELHCAGSKHHAALNEDKQRPESNWPEEIAFVRCDFAPSGFRYLLVVG